RQLVEHLLDVGVTREIDLLGANRLDWAVAGRIWSRNERTGHDDRFDDGLVRGHGRRRKAHGCCGSCSQEQSGVEAALAVDLIHLEPPWFSRNDVRPTATARALDRLDYTRPNRRRACTAPFPAKLKASWMGVKKESRETQIPAAGVAFRCQFH